MKRCVYEESLTNEVLTSRFKNQFELARYAIALAQNKMLSGKEPKSNPESNNLAFRVLCDIAETKDTFESLENVRREREQESQHVATREKKGSKKDRERNSRK